MPRRQLNITSICFSLLVPWAVFVITTWVLGFTIRYLHASLSYVFVGCIVVATLICGCLALAARRRKGHEDKYQPSWLVFVFISMVLAVVLSSWAGHVIFYSHMLPYYKAMELNMYVDVKVDRVNGQQSMDAGRIVFAEGTTIDVQKSMGFRSIDVYCVAPIVLGNTTLATYDYWAVGKGCCSGVQADFHCENYNDQRAASGMRLMDDHDRAFYRLAVQQAEAMHNIKAAHPLFFTWVPDVVEAVDEFSEGGVRLYQASIGGHLLLQAFLVASCTLAFSRLPHF